MKTKKAKVGYIIPKTFILASEDRLPVLFLDVNLGGGKVKRLIIKDGDDYMKIASQFCQDNSKQP